MQFISGVCCTPRRSSLWCVQRSSPWCDAHCGDHEFENTLGCLTGAQMGSKNRGRKSRDTLPLMASLDRNDMFNVDSPQKDKTK